MGGREWWGDDRHGGRGREEERHNGGQSYAALVMESGGRGQTDHLLYGWGKKNDPIAQRIGNVAKRNTHGDVLLWGRRVV